MRFAGSRLAGRGLFFDLQVKLSQAVGRLRRYGLRRTFEIYADLVKSHRNMRRLRKKGKGAEKGNMRVLMIDYYLPDSIYSLELGRELKKHCDLTIFCREDAGVYEEGITWLPCFYPGGKRKLRAMWEYGLSLLRLSQVIRRGRFDVVHVQIFKNVRWEMMVYRLLRRYYKKLVWTVHNVLPHEAGAGEKERYGKIYGFCDALIVHNQTSKKCLMEQFPIPEDKIAVIPHGAYKTHMGKADAGHRDKKIHFLQFGFIRKYKGIDILLKAVSLIPEKLREGMEFTIAGKQYEKLDSTDYPAMIRELGIGDWVSFKPGHVPDEEIDGLLGQADFLIFPYRHIYGSGALLFSYTYQKPVIVSDIPAFLEETEDGSTGFIFESENPRALAQAIVRAAGAAPRELASCRAAMERLVREKYNWSISAKRTAEVYERQGA